MICSHFSFVLEDGFLWVFLLCSISNFFTSCTLLLLLKSKLQAVNIELLEIRKPCVRLHASYVAQQEEFFLISAFDVTIIFVGFFCNRLAFVNVA